MCTAYPRIFCCARTLAAFYCEQLITSCLQHTFLEVQFLLQSGMQADSKCLLEWEKGGTAFFVGFKIKAPNFTEPRSAEQFFFNQVL